jgi:phospholipid/cholesterol/gamma-HCH transport system substrate-binding protein
MTRRARRGPAGLLAFLVACGAIFAYMWHFAGGTTNPLSSRYEVQAVVPSAVALSAHADVRHAGVKVGQVQRIATRVDNAVLLLELQSASTPVHRDATVLVRTKTLSGENYVDLDPGSARTAAVPSGGILPLGNAGQAVQLDEVLSTFDRRTRRNFQRVLDGLGRGLRRNGPALNRFLDGSATLVDNSQSVTAVLARDRRDVASLIANLGDVAHALGDRAGAIHRLARSSLAVSRAVAERDRQLRAGLHVLPAFLAQSRTTIAHLGRFSPTATPVLRDLRIGTERLLPATRLLAPTADRARTAMQALRRFAATAEPMTAHLRPFADAAARLTKPLASLLRQYNPFAAYLEPYARELAAVLGNMRAGTEYYDALGHYGRVGQVFSKSAIAGQFTADQDAALKGLLNAGVLVPLDTRGNNAYGPPGGADDIKPFNGTYPHIEPDPPYRSKR